MIKRYCSALLMGAVALIHGGLVQAGALDDAVRRGVLKVGTTPTYVPFEMTDKQGRIVGFEVDLLQAMSRALGVELELVAVPYTELLSGLMARKFDLIGSGMTVTQERNLKLIAMTRPENQALLVLEQPFTYEPLAFGLKKGDYDSLNWINHFLNQVAQDGTYDRLYDKWFKDTDWMAEVD